MKASRTLGGPGLEPYYVSVRNSGEFWKALRCEESQEVPRIPGRGLGWEDCCRVGTLRQWGAGAGGIM